MRHLGPTFGFLLCACAPQAASPGRTPGVVVSPPLTTTPDVYEMDGFSFVDELTAGMPRPGGRGSLESDLAFVADQGVVLVVSLTTDPVAPEALAAAGLEALHLPIRDMTPPTWEQQVAFVEEMLVRSELGEPVGVHCTAGLGRTGTMLATWFVAGGMDAEGAMAAIRALRPGSIETAAQEESVRVFAARWPAEG